MSLTIIINVIDLHVGGGVDQVPLSMQMANGSPIIT